MSLHLRRFSISMLFLALSALVLTGCRSTQPKVQLNIFNYTSDTVRDVEILQDGEVKYTIATLLPNRGIDSRPGGNNVPAVSTVRFTTVDGERVERNLQPADDLTKYFAGNVYYQIEKANEVRAFYMPSEGGVVSSMPWNTPAAFEGQFNLPGAAGANGR